MPRTLADLKPRLPEGVRCGSCRTGGVHCARDRAIQKRDCGRGRPQAATRDELAQLAAANHRLKLYVERAPLASIVWGTDQLVREWNPAAERMFGCTAAEAIGRNVYELTATPEGLEAIERVREKFRAGEPYPDVNIFKNKRKDTRCIGC